MNRKNLFIIVCLLFLFPVSGRAFQAPSGLSLEDALRIALEESPLIRISEAEIDLERSVKRQSWALPKTELSMEYEGMPEGSRFDTYGGRKMILSQGFEFPTSYYYRIRKHSYLVEQARFSLELSKLQLIADVKTAYTDAVLAQSIIELEQENVKLSSELLEKSELKFKLGEEGRKEYLWAKIEKSRAENRIHAARAGLKESIENLFWLISGKHNDGSSGDVILTGKLEFIPIDLSEFNPTGTELERHVLNSLNESAVNAASKSISLAKSSFLPDFSIAVFDHNVDNRSGFWGAAFGITLPVWFLTDQMGQISEAKAGKKIAEYKKIADYRKIVSEYRTAYTALEESAYQVQRFTGEILNEAEEMYDLAELSYREGETSYIDRLLAQRTFIETRMEYLETVADYNRAVARFELAAGRRIR